MFAVVLVLTAAISMVAGCCGRWLWFLLWRRGGGSPSSSAKALAPPAGAPPPPAGPPPPPPSVGPIPPPPSAGPIPPPEAAAGPSPPQQQEVKQQAPDSDLLQKILMKLQPLENLMKRSSESESSCRLGHGSTRSEALWRGRSVGGGGGHLRSGGRDCHDDYWYVFSCCQYSVYCIATYILIYFCYR